MEKLITKREFGARSAAVCGAKRAPAAARRMEKGAVFFKSRQQCSLLRLVFRLRQGYGGQVNTAALLSGKDIWKN